MQTNQLVGFLLGAGARPLAVQSGDMLTIGRDPQNSICLPDVLASRRHAIIECVADSSEVFIKDLGSSNGTFLNGRQLAAQQRTQMCANDYIRIGGKLLSFISNNPAMEPRAFGAKVSLLETVKGGLKFENGKVVEIPEVEEKQEEDVNATQQVPSLSSAQPSSALSGNLHDQNLAQIIQFLHTNAKTGELHVNGPRNQGLIAFDQGQIFFAEASGRRGAPAVYVCAREHDGTFSFLNLSRPLQRAKNVYEPMIQIIFECCKRMDETELAGMG
ncbi:MAG TPA: FHA domain-containing protein [Planctomycetota bacterium]|jgi:pSer/pThr/pTyr-binding forkhead associated (FHA) protein